MSNDRRRRMEVYHNIYDKHLNEVGELEPHIITESSYAEMLESSVIHFCGNGAFKILDVINHNNAEYTQIFLFQLNICILWQVKNCFKTIRRLGL